jgi:hypothetical protein
MSRSAEDLGFPSWVDAPAALFVFVVGVLVIYGGSAFIAWDVHPANWPGPGRFIFVIVLVCWSILVVHAASTDGEE